MSLADVVERQKREVQKQKERRARMRVFVKWGSTILGISCALVAIILPWAYGPGVLPASIAALVVGAAVCLATSRWLIHEEIRDAVRSHPRDVDSMRFG